MDDQGRHLAAKAEAHRVGPLKELSRRLAAGLSAPLTVAALLVLAGCGGSGLQQADPKLPATCTPEPNQEPHCVQGSDVQVAAVQDGDSCQNGKWVAGQTNFDGSATLTCRNVDLERVNGLAGQVAVDLQTVQGETAQLQSSVNSALKTLQGLRNDSVSILRDNAQAARSNCTQLFPDAPDSPDIGASYIVQGLSQLQSDAAQLQDDYAAYQQAAQVTPATTAPDDAAATDAMGAAKQAVKVLSGQIQAADSEAQQIVAKEKPPC